MLSIHTLEPCGSTVLLARSEELPPDLPSPTAEGVMLLRPDAEAELLQVDKSICKVGCLLSSVAMALAGHRVTVDATHATPASLNKWLQSNQVSPLHY